MLIGVISDTHDNTTAIDNAVSVFRDRGVDVIVHCGDYIAPPVLPAFEGFEVHGVLGNNDGERDGLELGFDQLGNGSHLHGRYATLEFEDSSVFVLHGDQGRDAIREYAASKPVDYVFYGHFHKQAHQTVNGTTVINPGAHFPTVPAQHRSVCIIDTATGTPEFIQP